ncbi:conserved hypothetical protein [Burkholderia diffusa]|uniref:hypothetical protein n=1 Tax=Burkholderia diffusa TaxID=488732 RepID=UPI001CB06B24|nr:hypothetical protein [Burkholderia diffusa]CAG9265709.1 conserved hypothetical protein [Burkholderia diffusa]
MSDLVESSFAGQKVMETAGARQDQSRELADLQVNYLMARQFPRDPILAMDRILMAFTRVTLAEKSQYQFARGGTDIRGPSIKAMQAIATEWGNLDIGWRERSRGIDARGVPFSEIEAYCADLETRTRKRIAFIVPHWRDRSDGKGGGLLLESERDIYEQCANMAQRRLRACIEGLIPADVIERAMAQADATLHANADTSTDAMTKMVAAFAPFDVTKEMIEHRIQRRLDAITAAQVVNLKRIYASLRDGMSTAAEWFDRPTGGRAANTEGESRTAAVKSRMRTRRNARGPREAEPSKRDNSRPTYSDIAAALKKAKTLDALNTAADLIRGIPDEAQRTELEQLYRVRASDIDDGG